MITGSLPPAQCGWFHRYAGVRCGLAMTNTWPVPFSASHLRLRDVNEQSRGGRRALPQNAPSRGKFPFSFAWAAGGHLLLTEVFGTGATLTASAVQPFNLNSDGTLTPVADGAASGMAPLVTPIDQALSPDGNFLYQLSPGNGMVVPFAISNASGGLTQLSSVSDGLGTGQSPQGVAAVDFS
jgi:hypothetical protein